MILPFGPWKAISVPRKWRRGKVSANVYWSVPSCDFITTTQKIERGLPDHESYSEISFPFGKYVIM
jgi:hypothetical protein